MTSIAKNGAWIALFAGWLLIVTPVRADTVLTPHTAEYKVKISVLGGFSRISSDRTVPTTKPAGLRT